jgi:hypothetical protein
LQCKILKWDNRARANDLPVCELRCGYAYDSNITEIAPPKDDASFDFATAQTTDEIIHFGQDQVETQHEEEHTETQ